MDYIVNFRTNYSSDQQVNAQAKAPADVTRTLKSLGFKELCLLNYNPLMWNGKTVSKWKGYYRRVLDYVDKWYKYHQIHDHDRVFFQYHGPTDHLYRAVCKVKAKGSSIHFIIHDLRSVRFNEKTEEEFLLLKKADMLYVHTETMKAYLKSIGCQTSMCTMHLFDYYTADPMQATNETIEQKNVVVFAGNLDKSSFLHIMNENNSSFGYTLRLYGMSNSYSFSHPDIKYKGIFSPKHTGKVHGGWGLLWDGPSIDTCEGLMGNYLRYNSSHKLSLYLAQGIPLILWKESSLAEWAIMNKVAILISSIREIQEKINSLTTEQYTILVNNARRIGDELRKGHFLQKAIIDNLS